MNAMNTMIMTMTIIVNGNDDVLIFLVNSVFHILPEKKGRKQDPRFQLCLAWQSLSTQTASNNSLFET